MLVGAPAAAWRVFCKAANGGRCTHTHHSKPLARTACGVSAVDGISTTRGAWRSAARGGARCGPPGAPIYNKRAPAAAPPKILNLFLFQQ